MNDAETSELFAGRFRLGEELGAGAVGRTYRATDLVRQEPVAVKLVHDDLAAAAGGLPGLVPLLRAAARLGHPALGQLHDFNLWEGRVYLSLELLRGPTLDRLLPEGRRWTLSAAARALRPVAEALAHAAPAGAHRSLRPGHLHWLPGPGDPGSEGRFKLADFGLGGLLTRAQRVGDATLRGHSPYLAPEILTGTGDADEAADRFAFGQLWLAMVRGEPLLPGQDLAGVEPGRELALLRRLLATRPTDRPASWPEVLAELAPPAPTGHRWRFPRTGPRRWRAAAGALALSLAAVAGFQVWRTTQRSVPAASLPEELRAEWAAWDAQRLNLLARAAAWPDWLPTVQTHFAPVRDWTLARDWWRATESPPRRPDLRAGAEQRLRQALGALREEASAADRALAARAALAPWADQAALVLAEPGPALHLPAGTAALGPADDAFRDQRFQDAAEQLERELGSTTNAWQQAAAEHETAAGAALEAWRGSLRTRGWPETEPNRDLTGELAAARAARGTNDWPGAFRRWREVRSHADAWLAELRAVPPAAPGQRENSLGLRFAPVGPLWVAVWETRVLDFAAFVAETGHDSRYYWRREAADDGPTHPVVMITPEDARAFCRWLTQREAARGGWPAGAEYRLPTDAEWSAFAGLAPEPEATPDARSLNAPDHWPWGAGARTAGSGNYHTPLHFAELAEPHRRRTDQFVRTAPVGSFPPSVHGLHDLGGNVWEFVSDFLQPEFAAAVRGGHTARGGSFRTAGADRMRTGHRHQVENNDEDVGFRLVLAGGWPSGPERPAP